MHNRWREFFQEYGAECLVIFLPVYDDSDDFISAHLPQLSSTKAQHENT